MKRERVIEIATYIMVFLAMWIVSPWIGKLIDQLYYQHSGLFSYSLPLLLTGGVVALLGFGLAIWTIVIFKTIGKGTPNPKVPPTEMVISGPYKYSRNPMAFGGFLFLLGRIWNLSIAISCRAGSFIRDCPVLQYNLYRRTAIEKTFWTVIRKIL